MTTIPLSMREGYGQALSGADGPSVTAYADDNKLDELIDNVSETLAHRGSPDNQRDEILLDESPDDGDTWRDLKARLDEPDAAEERGPESELDRALKAAVDRRASQETESADFRESKEWRDALHERYDGRVAIGDLLDQFADWHESLKANPRAAADALASAYLEQPAYALPDPAALEKRGTPPDIKDGGPDRKLDSILAAMIDRHHGKGDGEQQAFGASARHRAVLKEMFPGMTYAEACRRVVMLDGDLHRDPIATAARLAATYRMPATSSQHIAVERRDAMASDAQRVIASTAENWPGLADMENELVTVLNRPDFMHGPDMQENLLRAHRVVQLARHEGPRLGGGTDAKRAAMPRGLDGLIAQAMQGRSLA